MKSCLALFIVFFPIAAGHAAENTPSAGEHAISADRPVSPKALAEQVSDIVNSPALSPKEKRERISAAVQDTVMAATARLKTPAEVLKSALEYAAVAAEAAPQFTDAIAGAVLAIPSIAAIDGAAAKIQAAVVDAATRAAGAEFSSDKHRGHRDPEFGGDKDDTVVSRYR